MAYTDDREAVSSDQITSQEAGRIAIETAVAARLVGGTLILSYWLFKGDIKVLMVWGLYLLLTFTPMLLLANFLGLALFRLFQNTAVPMRLFVRVCALLFEVSLFTWQVMFLMQIHPDEWRLFNGRY